MHKGTLVSLFLFSFLMSNHALADCPDTIEDPGKATSVKYRVGHYYPGSWKKLWTDAGCKKSGIRSWEVPDRTGKSCASGYIDGCSFNGWGFVFTDRDKKLMTPSCNQHDLCYNTDGTTKSTCDDEFLANLQKTKKKFSGSYIATVPYEAVKKYGDHAAGQKRGKEANCSY